MNIMYIGHIQYISICLIVRIYLSWVTHHILPTSLTTRLSPVKKMDIIVNNTNVQCDKSVAEFVDFSCLSTIYACSKGSKAAVLETLRARFSHVHIDDGSHLTKRSKVEFCSILDVVPLHNRDRVRMVIKSESHFDALLRMRCMLCGEYCESILTEYGFLAHSICLEKEEVCSTSGGICEKMSNYIGIPQRGRCETGKPCVSVLPHGISDIFPSERSLRWYTQDGVEIRVARKQVIRDDEEEEEEIQNRENSFCEEIEDITGGSFWEWSRSLHYLFRPTSKKWYSTQECLKGLDIFNNIKNTGKSFHGLNHIPLGKSDTMSVKLFVDNLNDWDRCHGIGNNIPV